jgi:hypothetical protein
MAANELPEVVQRLVTGHLPTLDHVTALLAAYAAPDQLHDSMSIAPIIRVDEKVAAKVLSELAASHLLEREGAHFRFASTPEVREAVEQLALMYNTRPVTLIRAIYDRPASSAQSFADAFRIRRTQE